MTLWSLQRGDEIEDCDWVSSAGEDVSSSEMNVFCHEPLMQFRNLVELQLYCSFECDHLQQIVEAVTSLPNILDASLTFVCSIPTLLMVVYLHLMMRRVQYHSALLMFSPGCIVLFHMLR